MFEDASGANVLAQVRAHTFDPRPLEAGYERIEAITALDRLIRQSQAEQAVQIVALHRERTQMMSLGDPTPTAPPSCGSADPPRGSPPPTKPSTPGPRLAGWVASARELTTPR